VSKRLSSSELVALVRIGRSDAGQELCVRLEARVKRLVSSKLGADSEARDVAQDAFEQILRSMHSLQDPAQIELWVSTITAHTVSRELRRRRRRPCVLCADFEAMTDLRVEPDLDGSEALGRVARILEQLSGEQRNLVWLDRFERNSVNELALATGLKMSTLKRRLRLARRRFGRLVAKDALLRSRGKARLWAELPRTVVAALTTPQAIVAGGM
jgi:RNA polymerase sigma-70 factor, ECF subfamily